MPFDGKAIATPIADALRATFDKKGWCKYVTTDLAGRYCLLGGLWANGMYSQLPLITEAILAVDPTANDRAAREELMHPRGTKNAGFIALWNNAAETTFADITRMIDAVAEIERQRALVNA